MLPDLARIRPFEQMFDYVYPSKRVTKFNCCLSKIQFDNFSHSVFIFSFFAPLTIRLFVVYLAIDSRSLSFAQLVYQSSAHSNQARPALPLSRSHFLLFSFNTLSLFIFQFFGSKANQIFTFFFLIFNHLFFVWLLILKSILKSIIVSIAFFLFSFD